MEARMDWVEGNWKHLKGKIKEQWRNLTDDEIDIRTMDELFVRTLRDTYYAEQKILQALPTMIEYVQTLS
jgi:Domain of unknown function (DUF892)